MITMNISHIGSHLRVAAKQSACAFALAVGLAAGSVQAATTTIIIELGAFESGGTPFAGGDLVSEIPLGSLPAGSILRSVTMNYRLEAGDPYLGDLRVLFADATADNGVLQIAGTPDDGGYTKTASPSVTWNSGSDFSVGATATQTLTAADGIPAIDLNTVEVWLHTGYPGSWAGSITLEYDEFEPAAITSFGPGAVVGELVANAAAITWTVPTGTNLTALAPTFTLSSGTCDRDSGGPTTYDFTSPVVYTVTDGPTVNTYTVTVTVANALQWNVAGGGDWDTSTANWLPLPSGPVTTFANGNEVIFDNTAGGTITIAPDMSPAFTTVNAASGTYTFSGGPIATGSLTKSGAGELVVKTTNNSFGGGTIVNDGRLRLDLDLLKLGDGPITLNDGEIFLWRARPTNALVVNGGKVIAENGFNNNRFDGPITLNTTLICDVFYQLTCSNTISGVGGLTKTSTSPNGPLILSGTSSYTGPTTIMGGTLRCDSPDAVASGDLSISSGGAKMNLNYTGTKAIGTLTLGGVVQINPGTYGSPTSDATFKSNYFEGLGTVTTGDPASAAFMVSFGTNVAGSIALIDAPVAGAASISWLVPDGTDLATLAPEFAVSVGATCIDQTSGLLPSPNFGAGPVVYTVVSQNTSVTITYTVTVSTLPDDSSVTWNLPGGGNWNLSSINWTGQPSNVSRPYFDGADVIFNNTGGGTIAIDAEMAPLSTTVSAASGTYTFTGGPIASGSLTKDGGGTLVIKDWNSYSGGTIIETGTLRIDWPGDANPKKSLGSGPVTLEGGSLTLNRTLLANAFTVNGGSMFLDNGFGNTLTGPIILNVDLNVTAQYANHPLSGDISGPGGITMTSSAGGGLILSGNNSYTGTTTVTGGTVRIESPAALSGGSAVSISGSGKVNLNYAGTKNVASLTLGGLAQTTPGTYGSIASGANFQSDTWFTTGSTGTVTIGGGSDYDTWLDDFTFAPGADITATGDPDGDGVSNEEEYAFGLNPTLGSSANPIVAPLDPVTGNLQYTRRATPAATGLTYTVLTSTTLAGWTAGGATETGFTTSGNIQTVTVNVTAPPVGGKLFVRVEAEEAP
jgi:autotransporter-associated beta strand protein